MLVNSKNVTDRVAAGYEKSKPSFSNFGGLMSKKAAYGNPSTNPGFGKQFVVTKAEIDYDGYVYRYGAVDHEDASSRF